jgi:hypothetical protein
VPPVPAIHRLGGHAHRRVAAVGIPAVQQQRDTTAAHATPAKRPLECMQRGGDILLEGRASVLSIVSALSIRTAYGTWYCNWSSAAQFVYRPAIRMCSLPPRAHRLQKARTPFHCLLGTFFSGTSPRLRRSKPLPLQQKCTCPGLDRVCLVSALRAYILAPLVPLEIRAKHAVVVAAVVKAVRLHCLLFPPPVPFPLRNLSSRGALGALASSCSASCR